MTDANRDAGPDTDAPATHHERVLRRAAAFVGIPLALAIGLPWFRGHDFAFPWEFATSVGFAPLRWFPFCGLLFVAAAFAPKLSLTTRRGLVTVAGCVGFGLALALPNYDIIGDFRDLRRIGVFAAHILFSAWVVSAGLEMASHSVPRSRGLAWLSALGWLLFILAMFVPLDARLNMDKSIAGSFLEAITRQRRSWVVNALSGGLPLLIATIGLFGAVRRGRSDRESAARVRPRTNVLAYLMVPVSLTLGALLASVAVVSSNEPRALTSVLNSFGIGLGICFGSSLAVAAVAVEASLLPRQTRRFTAIAVATLLLGAWLVSTAAQLMQGSDGDIADVAESISGATIAAIRGEPIDAEYLGPYDGFDLRAAAQTLGENAAAWRSAEKIEPVAVAIRVRRWYARRRIDAWVIHNAQDELRWTSGPTHYDSVDLLDSEDLSQAHAGFASAVYRLADAARQQNDCLPELTAADLQGSSDPLQRLLPPTADRLCQLGEIHGERVRRFGDSPADAALGNVDRYLVVLKIDGQVHAIEGALRLNGGRFWIGEPALLPAI